MNGAITVDIADGVRIAFARTADVLPGAPADEHRAGRALLDDLLTRTAGPRLAGARVATERNGRPYLPAHPGIGVTISHSGPYVAAGVGLGLRVGVDAEVPAPVSPGLRERCCSTASLNELERLPDERAQREFVRIWTVQEACVKGAGLGLAGAPWRIPVEVGQHRGHWNGFAWRSLPDRFPIPVSCAFESPHASTPHASTPHASIPHASIPHGSSHESSYLKEGAP
ncbi:4'-phosphopantetheinyl transferase superfamily protein [Actinomadura barringtoniae]|uniref:4'-phosphopantetheinyl transferase superfamily protein n=1 Tax=Actinomadura barringtoniae TaxID=1427535 RepID=A0A939PCV4_9ACTN|nr:4'-phosphopantetheinyl transferase superfamily protein [Actinomadura barringtoniae]MBO2450270.1 4'-phosphopantetheinyl transferase superfamily protein [Actinomadura barringtoniae]